MPSSLIRCAIFGCCASLLLVSSTAQAAKGVKKATLANGQRIVTGIVMTMAPDGNGGGTIQLRAANQQRKGVAANTASNSGNPNAGQNGTQVPNQMGRYNIQTINVTPETQFNHQNGAVLSGSEMTVGTHVRVLATGDQAATIQIMSNNSSMANFMRHRMNNYTPHHYRWR
jgi:hypothetical protein